MQGLLTEVTPQNETVQTIYRRRAVRKYKDKPVDRQLIEELLSAGRMAPSAMNKQPWKFYVVTNNEIIHTLSGDIKRKAFKETIKSGVKGILKTVSGLFHFMQSFDLSAISDPVFYNAPVVIFITAREKTEWVSLDIGMCAENIMLAAKSVGLDTCPIGFAKFVSHTEHYSLLNIPDSETVQLAVVVGYGDENPPVHKRNTDNVTFIE